MKSKKLLYAFLLLLVLPYFIMIACFFSSSGRKGDAVATVKQYFQVSVEDGVIADAVDYVPFTVPREGSYLFNLDYVTNEPGFYTVIVAKDNDGNAIFHFGAFSITGFANQVSLPEGRGTIELHYITSEQGLRDFCAKYPLFTSKEIDNLLPDLNFDSFTKTGSWSPYLTMNVYEMVAPPAYYGYATLALGIVMVILLFLLIAKDHPSETDDEKACITSVSIRYSLFFIALILFQLLFSVGLRLFLPAGFVNDNRVNLSFLLTILSVDVVGFSIIVISTKKLPARVPEKHPFGFGQYLLFVLMSAGLCGLGSVIGSIFHGVVGGTGNTTLTYLMLNSGMFMRVLTVGILAPIFEELIFRKFMIDHLLKHGEFIAILISGLSFGLYHGNFQQFFFATFIGWLWAFLYVRTGRVINTILLHATINTCTSVITVFLVGKYLEFNPTGVSDTASLIEIMQSSQDAMLYIGLYGFWSLLLFTLVIVGLIIFIVFFASKKFQLQKQENEPSKGKTIGILFSNPGYWIYVLACAGEFIMNYLPAFLN